jgi:hypothetical protein
MLSAKRGDYITTLMVKIHCKYEGKYWHNTSKRKSFSFFRVYFDETTLTDMTFQKIINN